MDLEKVYDKDERDALWKELPIYDVEGKFLEVVKVKSATVVCHIIMTV